MSAAITFRPATRADLPLIVSMRDALNDLERAGCPHAPIQRLDLATFTSLWGHTLDSPDHCWRIVEADGQPAGFGLIYLLATKSPPPGAFIHWMYVAAAQRRSGVGQQLFDEMLGWARNKGANRIELRFIDGNEAAQRFWAKMGFQPFARQCVRHLEDH